MKKLNLESEKELKIFYVLCIKHLFSVFLSEEISFIWLIGSKLINIEPKSFLAFFSLSFLLETVYFIIALLNDFFGSNEVSTGKKLPALRKLRDFIYTSILFPLAFAVSGLFWGLYIIDRELVFPDRMAAYFPWWLNLMVHTNIVIFLLIETVILYHNYPSRKLSLAAVLILIIAYIAWIYVIRFVAGAWVYPILNVLSGIQKIGFYAFAIIALYALYFVGEFVNSRVWNKKRIE